MVNPEQTDEPFDLDDAAAAIGDLQDEAQDDIPDDQDDPDEKPLEGDEPDDSQDDDDDEPSTTAIDVPASLNAEEKARFAQLPQEAQRMLADVETRRARQVTEATTNAANAQREAQSSAARDVLQAKQQFAEQLHSFAAAYQPRQPNPADYGDMQQYARDHAQWQYASAQHQELMQQVQAIGGEAQADNDRQTADRAQAEQQKLRQTLPDWFDAEKGPTLRNDLTTVGQELGYSSELMAQADAGDLMALNKALGWKRDSEKYQKILGRQMQGVRAAKKSAPAGVTQPQGSGRRQAAKEATARAAQSGDLNDAAAAIAALGM